MTVSHLFRKYVGGHRAHFFELLLLTVLLETTPGCRTKGRCLKNAVCVILFHTAGSVHPASNILSWCIKIFVLFFTNTKSAENALNNELGRCL